MNYRYSVVCPHCNTWNDNRDLDETDGYFECDTCGKVSRMYPYNPDTLPMFTLDNFAQQFTAVYGSEGENRQKKAV